MADRTSRIVTLPNGQQVKITGDREPTAEDLQAIMASLPPLETPPPQGPGRIAPEETIWNAINQTQLGPALTTGAGRISEAVGGAGMPVLQEMGRQGAGVLRSIGDLGAGALRSIGQVGETFGAEGLGLTAPNLVRGLRDIASEAGQGEIAEGQARLGAVEGIGTGTGSLLPGHAANQQKPQYEGGFQMRPQAGPATIGAPMGAREIPPPRPPAGYTVMPHREATIGAGPEPLPEGFMVRPRGETRIGPAPGAPPPPSMDQLSRYIGERESQRFEEVMDLAGIPSNLGRSVLRGEGNVGESWQALNPEERAGTFINLMSLIPEEAGMRGIAGMAGTAASRGPSLIRTAQNMGQEFGEAAPRLGGEPTQSMGQRAKDTILGLRDMAGAMRRQPIPQPELGNQIAAPGEVPLLSPEARGRMTDFGEVVPGGAPEGAGAAIPERVDLPPAQGAIDVPASLETPPVAAGGVADEEIARKTALMEEAESLHQELGSPWGDRDDFSAFINTDPADLNETAIRSVLKELQALRQPAAAAADPAKRALQTALTEHNAELRRLRAGGASKRQIEAQQQAYRERVRTIREQGPEAVGPSAGATRRALQEALTDHNAELRRLRSLGAPAEEIAAQQARYRAAVQEIRGTTGAASPRTMADEVQLEPPPAVKEAGDEVVDAADAAARQKHLPELMKAIADKKMTFDEAAVEMTRRVQEARKAAGGTMTATATPKATPPKGKGRTSASTKAGIITGGALGGLAGGEEEAEASPGLIGAGAGGALGLGAGAATGDPWKMLFGVGAGALAGGVLGNEGRIFMKGAPTWGGRVARYADQARQGNMLMGLAPLKSALGAGASIPARIGETLVQRGPALALRQIADAVMATPQGLREAANVAVTGQSPMFVPQPNQVPAEGIFSLPRRIMGTVDAPFRRMHMNMTPTPEEAMWTLSQGLKPEDLAARELLSGTPQTTFFRGIGKGLKGDVRIPPRKAGTDPNDTERLLSTINKYGPLARHVVVPVGYTTSSNVIEQGLQRTPGLNLLTNALVPSLRQNTRQTIGNTLTGGVAGLGGMVTDASLEQDEWTKRGLASAAMGKYALPFGLGMAINRYLNEDQGDDPYGLINVIAQQIMRDDPARMENLTARNFVPAYARSYQNPWYNILFGGE